jgi:ribonuclease BN (tRNA processing enzyme)
MQIHVLGSGDAFGSGGRFNTCLHVAAPNLSMLLDCGASSMVALKRAGVSTDALDAVLFTHFHGDHFGGLPFIIIDAQFVAKRRRPLTILGPPGIADRTRTALEAAFPGAWSDLRSFELVFREIAPDTMTVLEGVEISSVPVVHDEQAGPCVGYRLRRGEKTFAFSGDTGWTDRLLDLARAADVFLCECYTWDRPLKLHLSWTTLAGRLDAVTCRRMVLTHMGPEMLAHVGDVLPVDRAFDGMVLRP